MIDWRRGGWTGSLNRWVKREVREQFRVNLAARRARYGIIHRSFRKFFSIGTFGRFLCLYLIVDLVFVAIEILTAKYLPGWLPLWTASGPAPNPDIKSLVLNVSSYLVTAQVGTLGVISLALALVTLIGQNEGSSTDVKVYYHESLSFEIVASCIALLAVLCAQLLWPFQFLLHRLGLGTDLMVFKLSLLSLHLGWLLLNLSAVGYFIVTTFRFVQQSARESLRERYTVNVVQPIDMIRRLRETLYSLATKELLGDGGGGGDDEQSQRPSATFGFDFGDPHTVEIEKIFTRPGQLHDVRMTWVRWVVRRWSARCLKAAVAVPAHNPAGLGQQGPEIWFTPHIEEPLRGVVGWCRRRDGVPLTAVEKLVLRRAFRFRRSDSEA